MNTLFQNRRLRTLLIGSFFLISAAVLVIFQQSGDKLKADILESSETGFSFWYLEDSTGVKSLDIPENIGSVVELPLGIKSAAPQMASALDSLEFRFIGLPDFLQFNTAAAFPGFHVDTMTKPGTSLETYDLSVFVTPEEFEDANWEPGAPNVDTLGNLIRATDEILILSFEVVATPVADLSPISLSAILTERNGDFTHHLADGNPDIAGNNPGTLELHILSSNFPQVEAAYPAGTDAVVLDMTVPLLPGVALPGALNMDNYYVYKCGSHLPSPDPRDPLFDDAESCRQQIQDSIAEPGLPLLATLDEADTSKVTLKIDSERAFVEGAQYIVFLRNIGDESGQYFIPEAGIFSQPFTWTAYPTVKAAVAMDPEVLHVIFNEPVCAATETYGATNKENYTILPCNLDSDIDKCLEVNLTSAEGVEVIDVLYDGDRTVSLVTAPQAEGVYYVVLVKNIRNGNCDPASEIPVSPSYYSPQFSGFNTNPQAGELSLNHSKNGTIHLPWREIMEFSPSGGMPPYELQLLPPEAGILDYNPSTGEAVFKPRLVDSNNQALHDERDVTIKVTDYLGDESEIKVHVLRRGDLGGRDARLLDKTDVQDVNDISAGWKR